MTQNTNGLGKKVYNWVLAIATVVGMTIAISAHLKDIKDNKARQQLDKARAGYTNHSKDLEKMSEDIRENRRLLMTLTQTLLRRSETRPPAPSISGFGRGGGGASTRTRSAPAPRPVPRSAPVPETKKKLPPIRKQQQWQELELK